MIVVFITAVILTFAIPSFIEVINNNRVTTAVNDLSASFAIARTEAVKANSTVQVKPTNGTDWSRGYDIRVEGNDLDTTFDDDERVRIFEPADDSILINSTTTVLTFNSLGGLGQTFFPTSTTESFTFTAPRAFGRRLTLTSSGAATICVEPDTCW